MKYDGSLASIYFKALELGEAFNRLPDVISKKAIYTRMDEIQYLISRLPC